MISTSVSSDVGSPGLRAGQSATSAGGPECQRANAAARTKGGLGRSALRLAAPVIAPAVVKTVPLAQQISFGSALEEASLAKL